MNFRDFTLTTLAALALFVAAGCSAKKIMINSVARALSSESSLVFTGEDDPELVAGALPFALKTYETLLEKTPNHHDLLIAAGKGFVTYAFAFIQMPSDELTEDQLAQQQAEHQRAKKLYLRGLDYLLRALEVSHPGFLNLVTAGNIDSALALAALPDTTALYWGGMAWMGALTADKADIDLMVSMPRAVGFMKRLSVLDSAYGEGAVDEFFLSYYGGLPASMGGSEKKAREHFNRTLELSHNRKAGPYVALASTVSVRNQNLAEFRDLLHKALAVDVTHRDKYRLTNVIYQQKARWLLGNFDRFFVSDEPSKPDSTGDSLK
jgi:predicted anti-sigma-YlaC factor YlaD